MIRYQLVVTGDAELDIAEAQSWYQDQAQLGADFIDAVERQLRLIEAQPFAVAIVARGIRRAVVARFPYNIYYAVNGSIINVLAVWHGRRDQRQLLP